jgi:HD-like signal output (HDOD) protein
MPLRPTVASNPLACFEQAVDTLDVCAPAPTVVQRLLAVLLDGRASWVELERTLAVDGGLVARVLRLASTAAFCARQVTSLRYAVQALGSDQLRRVVVAAQFAGGGTPFTRALWAYALRIACTSDALARHVASSPAADPFLCGLLHDVGTMALERFLGPSYTRAGFAPGDDAQVEIERDAFGFDHGDVGALVAARWRLFPELGPVAQFHHRPDATLAQTLPRTTRAAIDIVALARAVTTPRRAAPLAPDAVDLDALGPDVLDPDALDPDVLGPEVAPLCARLGIAPGEALARGVEGQQLAHELIAGLG